MPTVYEKVEKLVPGMEVEIYRWNKVITDHIKEIMKAERSTGDADDMVIDQQKARLREIAAMAIAVEQSLGGGE